MTAGFLQLTISGQQDVYLTGNPQISFFKSVYKRYSKYSTQLLNQDINGTPHFNTNINSIINKSGDLLKNIYLEITLPDLIKPTGLSWFGYVNNIGCSIIDRILLRINDQIIETIYGDWIDIYNNINNINIDKITKQYNSDYMIRNINNIDLEKRTFYVPIPFFFTKSSSLALPIVALNQSDISIDISFKKLEEVIKVSDKQLLNQVQVKPDSKFECNLWAEYIYLDDAEKKYFSTKKLEYLIEQTQFNGNEVLNKNDLKKNVYLDFRHPVKELIWTISIDNSNLDTFLNVDHNNITKYTTRYSDYKDTFNTLSIKLNSLLLLNNFKAEYYRKIQSYYYHNNTRNKYIYSYSFSLNPTQNQPSGHLNFSELNDALFIFDFVDSLTPTAGKSTNGIIKIYAINYNILQINSGQGSLQYYIN